MNIKNITSYLQKDKKNQGYVCPFCASGTGKNGTGMTQNPETKNFHCWNCGRDYTDIQLIGKLTHGYSLEETKAHYQELISELNPASPVMPVYELSFWNGWNSTKAYKHGVYDSFTSLVDDLRNISKQNTSQYKEKSICFTNPVIDKDKSKTNDNIKPSNLAFIDIDDETKDKVQAVIEVLKEFRCCYWHTHSSTEDKPRIRAIVALDKIASSPDEYAYIVNSLNKYISKKCEGIKFDDTAKQHGHAQNVAPSENEIYQFSGHAFKVFNSEYDLYQGILEKQSLIEPVKTGFTKLDEHLKGGLRNGLYVFGAPSNSGKSAFCLQLAEQIALQNVNVIYVSLEMAKYEHYSRICSKYDQDFTDDDTQRMNEILCECYWLKNLYILDDPLHAQLEDIEQTVKYFSNSRSVVIIDYLQIIQQRENEKENEVYRLKDIVTRLKIMSHDLPVIVISSLSRSAVYDIGSGAKNECKIEKADITAFSGSGSIEYTANWASVCVLDKDIFKIKVVKNRAGQKYIGLNYKFCNLNFTEAQTTIDYDQKRENRTINKKLSNFSYLK